MTGDDLRALPAEAVMDVDGEQQYGVVITRKQRDGLADLVDAARAVCCDDTDWVFICAVLDALDVDQ